MKKLVISTLLLAACISAIAAEKYAVLITGIKPGTQCNGTPVLNRDDYWNDTYLMWEQLMKKGYKNENIFVLYGDGNDMDNVNDRYQSQAQMSILSITDYAATINNVKNVFNHLKSKTTADDFLFVWTFDHGDLDLATNHSSLLLLDENLQNNVNMWDTTFARLVNKVPVNKKVVWMQRYNAQLVTDR